MKLSEENKTRIENLLKMRESLRFRHYLDPENRGDDADEAKRLEREVHRIWKDSGNENCFTWEIVSMIHRVE